MEKPMHNRLFSFAGGELLSVVQLGALIIQLEILQASTNKNTLCKHPYAEWLVWSSSQPYAKYEISYKAHTEISSQSFVFLLGRLNAAD